MHAEFDCRDTLAIRHTIIVPTNQTPDQRIASNRQISSSRHSSNTSTLTLYISLNMKLSIFTFIAIIMTLLASVAESIDKESKSALLRKRINELSEDSAKPSQDQRELWDSTWSRSWTWKSWDNDDDDWWSSSKSSKSTKSSKSSKSWSSSWDDDDWSSTSKSTKSTSKSSKSWNGDDDWRI